MTTETFHQVAVQPGSMVKRWNREELVRCRAVGTETTTKAELKGQAHPVFAHWTKARPELYQELEQPILLASKILEAVGLPWLSDFLIDDIFDEDYPGRGRSWFPGFALTYENKINHHSIARHHRAPWATSEKQAKWRDLARNTLRNEFPKLIQWQIDEDMFQQRGWNGYTCRHPRGELPLGELDKYETIKKFDRISLHEGSRNLTILVTAEYPIRLAELRRQGKVRSEEYLLTAFMTTVTLLHELGHAAYWKHRRSLRRDMREPFYGADLEMELGDSFIATIFGGWIPVPIRELSRLRDDFSFADGVAWRQALSWDHHRTRPKYRAHYSIPVDYIARLFTDTSWSTAPQKARALIRPRFLTGDSIALRTVGLYTPLTQANQHATAAIADFYCNGEGYVWNRRPGAWFRIPQYDGWMYPELEVPTAREDAICEPVATDHGHMATTRHTTLLNSSSTIESSLQRGDVVGTRVGLLADEGVETMTRETRQERDRDALSLSFTSLPEATTVIAATTMKPSPRKSEHSPRKCTPASPRTKIPRPISGGSPVPRCGVGASKPRKRTRVKTLPLAHSTRGASQDQSQSDRKSPSTSPSQVRDQRRLQEQQGVKHVGKPQSLSRHIRHGHDKEDRSVDNEDENVQCVRLGGCREDDSNKSSNNNVESHDRGEISVDELKKRLSQLIGVSLTELERLFDRPPCKPAGVE
ncbi:hypothetical protein F4859DRAFT_501619 [Xylaria cf. heliscus]|nr:hypothetical protein F4859DRAFT_501619 [Xylaria cf. heliscus]